MASGDTELSQDEIFAILSNPRRRYVLYFLNQHESAIELTDLAEHVAAWENDTTVEELNSKERKRVYVSLYQTHVPKLADHGLIDYDPESGMVRQTETSRRVDQYLDTDDEGIRWERIYGGLAIVSALLLLGVLVGVPVLATIGEGTILVLVVLAFVVASTVHYVTR